MTGTGWGTLTVKETVLATAKVTLTVTAALQMSASVHVLSTRPHTSTAQTPSAGTWRPEMVSPEPPHDAWTFLPPSHSHFHPFPPLALSLPHHSTLHPPLHSVPGLSLPCSGRNALSVASPSSQLPATCSPVQPQSALHAFPRNPPQKKRNRCSHLFPPFLRPLQKKRHRRR